MTDRRPSVPPFIRPDADSSAIPSVKHVRESARDKENVRGVAHDATRNQHQPTVKNTKPSQSQSQNQSCREREMENDSIKRKILMSSFSQMSDVSDKPVERMKKMSADCSPSISAHVKSVPNSAMNTAAVACVAASSGNRISTSINSTDSGASSSRSETAAGSRSKSNSSSSSSSSQGVDASQSTDQRSLNGYNYSESFSQVDQVGPDQASQPSKRARMMLQAALQPAVVARKDISGLLASINASKARSVGAGVVKGVGTVGVGGERKKKYVCAVCKSVAEEPCAARCGHICCETCWTQWLKRQQTCPCCRAPTTLQQIKKITILRS